MMSLLGLVEIDDLMVLLTSPPASGKTRLIFEVLEKTELQLIFISPLRALNEELKVNLSEYCVSDIKDLNNFQMRSRGEDKVLKPRIIIATAESYYYHFTKINELENTLVVIDEVHLFYMWTSFRPILKNVRQMILESFSRVLLLSATVKKSDLLTLKGEASLHFSNQFHIDLGNFKIKNYPRCVYVLSPILRLFISNFYFVFILIMSLKSKRVLLFTKYRLEVKKWVQRFSLLRVSSLGCVGGEADIFSKKLSEKIAQKDIPSFICATSVLSHGVNLPRLDFVLFDHDVLDESMFIQMLTRGGRKGEEFVAIMTKARYLKKELNYKPLGLFELCKELWI